MPYGYINHFLLNLPDAVVEEQTEVFVAKSKPATSSLCPALTMGMAMQDVKALSNPIKTPVTAVTNYVPEPEVEVATPACVPVDVDATDNVMVLVTRTDGSIKKCLTYKEGEGYMEVEDADEALVVVETETENYQPGSLALAMKAWLDKIHS